MERPTETTDWTKCQDKLGTTDTVSGMAQSLSQRVVELRAPAGSPALYIHDALMDAAQDAAWWIQGGNDPPDGDLASFATAHAAAFGYQAEEVTCLYLTGSKGNPDAPADISVLVTNLASEEQKATLRDPKWNEGGYGVGGSCYGLSAFVWLGKRQAAPGPNP